MAITLKLLTDNRVLALSKGEVKNFGKYLNYHHLSKPENDGLFCQKIFGPIIDYTCNCGITKKSTVESKCPECGVPFIAKSERSNRFGHIELNTYVLPPIAVEVTAEIWHISSKLLKSFTFDGKVKFDFVLDPKGVFIAKGARYALKKNEGEVTENTVTSFYNIVKVAKRLGIDPNLSIMENSNPTAQRYFAMGFNIFSMLLTKFPVSPCGMRDRVKQGDDLVYHEDNLIYHRIIRDALRIKTFQRDIEDEKEREELIALETRVIQNLINRFTYTGYKSNNKLFIPSKIDSLNHKEGLFREGALGKRIDFSGRSVITSGPFLDIDEVGVPMDMLIELFTPDLIREFSNKYIEEEGISRILALKKAKKAVSRKREIELIWDFVINKISPRYMALMNRAPSLHRFSVMSFRIKPTFDKCLYFPPLACKPFGADFDGDQLAIYIIHANKSRQEIRHKIAFSSNLMSSSKPNLPNASPSHEMVVGSYLLTSGYENFDRWVSQKVKKYYNKPSQAELDLYTGDVVLSDKVCFVLNGKHYFLTVGSILLYNVTGLIIDYTLGKGGISKLISTICNTYKNEGDQVRIISKLQGLLFETATKSGLSISIADCAIDSSYEETLNTARIKAESTPLTELSDVVINGDRIPTRAVIWDEAFTECVNRWFKETPDTNALKLMGKAGARVTEVQVKAMILGKGLQSTMDNKLDPNAIYKGLNVGLDPISYMATCGPARRGFTSNVAVVPASGYMTRQLVTAGRELTITALDCETDEGIIVDKKLAVDHYLIDGTLVKLEDLPNLDEFVKIRSPMTCKHNNGLCAKCCGVNPKNQEPFEIGIGIGVISAQTIAEILTQFALSYKHSSGSINLATFGKRVDNILADFLKFIGARSTQNVSLKSSIFPHSIVKLEGSTYEEQASNFVAIVEELFSNVGITVSPIWYEVIGRSLSDLVFEGKRAVGYRSKGYSCNKPKFQTVYIVNTNSPSWLKEMSFGYTKSALKKAIKYAKTTEDLVTERIIQGKNIIDG